MKIMRNCSNMVFLGLCKKGWKVNGVMVVFIDKGKKLWNIDIMGITALDNQNEMVENEVMKFKTERETETEAIPEIKRK